MIYSNYSNCGINASWDMGLLIDLNQFDLLIVGLSGGLDSIVLLHQLAQTPLKAKLRAVHVHHGLSPQASHWQQQCEAICTLLGIPCVVEFLNLSRTRPNLEALAREARYQVFQRYISKNSALITAHHQDDQAETLLLQLCRGAGVAGMRAMPLIKPFGQGVQVRPLLHFTRAELAAYAQQHQLSWCEDESNQDTRFNRNYLRHEILPRLSLRWPSVAKRLSTAAQHCSEAQDILEEVAAADLSTLLAVPEWPHGSSLFSRGINAPLDCHTLSALSSARQRNVLRFWLKQLNLPLPDQVHLQRIFDEVIRARDDAAPLVCWSGVEIRRYQHFLYAREPLDSWDAHQEYDWNLADALQISGLGCLRVTRQAGPGLVLPADAKVQIRFRQGGERFHPAGRRHAWSLKKCFNAWKIPPWQRDRIPLVYWHDQLVAVVGYAVSAPFFTASEGLIFSLTE
jgi:tRNA(Ile)-lysidine synthase